ncbi:MAG: hypothetical protein H0U71_08405 [Gammaproteobacteria bacterium]|nr:hypothetical protein [Gammaproteobacteria bacterium]
MNESLKPQPLSDNFWKWMAAKTQAMRETLNKMSTLNPFNTFLQQPKKAGFFSPPHQNDSSNNPKKGPQPALLKPPTDMCEYCGENDHNAGSCPKPKPRR